MRASVFQLMQWESAIGLEAKGIRHSSGRSVRMHACRVMGIKGRPKHAELQAYIEAVIEDAKRQGAGLMTLVEFTDA